MLYVGFVASGTSVLRAFGVPEGGVSAVPLWVCREGTEVLDEPSGVLGVDFVKMWRRAGPSAELWREISMGMLGLRYFIRGSISRQNFLGLDVSIWFYRVRWLVVCPDNVSMSSSFAVIVEQLLLSLPSTMPMPTSDKEELSVPCASVSAVDLGVELHTNLRHLLRQDQGAWPASYPQQLFQSAMFHV